MSGIHSQFKTVTVSGGIHASKNQLKQKRIGTLRWADKPAVKTGVSQFKTIPGKAKERKGAFLHQMRWTQNVFCAPRNFMEIINYFHSETKFFDADFLSQRQSIMVSRPIGKELPRPKFRKPLV